MNAFEELVADLLRQQGYWVDTSVKVKLSAKDKAAIGKPSAPRWEIDVVAYKGATNELLAVECKSYLDSAGVRLAALDGSAPRHAKRFKLFNDEKLCGIVLRRLVDGLVAGDSIARKPTVTLALACGKVASEANRDKLARLFEEKGWRLFDDRWIRTQVQASAKAAHHDSVAMMVAKILK